MSSPVKPSKQKKTDWSNTLGSCPSFINSLHGSFVTTSSSLYDSIILPNTTTLTSICTSTSNSIQSTYHNFMENTREKKTPANNRASNNNNKTIDLGFFRIDGNGVRVRPQFQIGVSGDSFGIGCGFDDIRNGFCFMCGFVVRKTFIRFHGVTYKMALLSLKEQILHLHRNNNKRYNSKQATKNNHLVRAVDSLIINEHWFVRDVLSLVGVNISTQCRHVNGEFVLKTGVGLKAGVAVGLLENEEGYTFYGVVGRMSALLSVGMSIQVGLHKNQDRIKIVLSMWNLMIVLVVFLKQHKRFRSPLPSQGWSSAQQGNNNLVFVEMKTFSQSRS